MQYQIIDHTTNILNYQLNFKLLKLSNKVQTNINEMDSETNLEWVLVSPLLISFLYFVIKNPNPNSIKTKFSSQY